MREHHFPSHGDGHLCNFDAGHADTHHSEVGQGVGKEAKGFDWTHDDATGPTELFVHRKADDETENADDHHGGVSVEGEQVTVEGDEAARVQETTEEDEDPRTLLEEGSSSAVGFQDVHEADDEADQQMDDTEVDREHDVFLKAVSGRGTVERIREMVHADEGAEVVRKQLHGLVRVQEAERRIPVGEFVGDPRVIVPHESETFCEIEAPKNAPDAHPKQDGEAVLHDGIRGQRLGPKEHGESDDHQAEAPVAKNGTEDHWEGEHHQRRWVVCTVRRTTHEVDHQLERLRCRGVVEFHRRFWAVAVAVIVVVVVAVMTAVPCFDFDQRSMWLER